MPETVLGSPVSFDGLASAAACASSAARDLADAISYIPPAFDWIAGGDDSSALDVNPHLVYAGSTGDAGPMYWSNDYTVEDESQVYRRVEHVGQPLVLPYIQPYIEQMRANDCCGFVGIPLGIRDDSVPERDVTQEEFDDVMEGL